jgi:hypothetical protein
VLQSQRTVVVLLVLFAVFITGCSETPNQVGSKTLPGQDLLQLDTATVYAVSSTSQPVIIGTSASPRILIGKLNSTEAWGLIRFATLPDSIKIMPFISAQLKLRTIYHFGDSLGAYSLALHNVLKYWVTDSLTIDSLKAAGFYDTKASGGASFGSVGDTVTISIPIDTSMIRTWGTVGDTVVAGYGVLLRPTNSTVIKGFGTFFQGDATLWPQLVLTFQGAAGTIDTLIVSTGSNRFVVTQPVQPWPSDSTHIYVQNGYAYRGAVDFDISSIPAHAAIHKATLQLTADAGRSQFNYFTADSLRAYFVADDGTTLTYLESISDRSQIGTSKMYQLSVGPFIQRWIRGATSRRLVIAGVDEWSALDLFALYGAGASKALKPKLTLYYSIIQ